ncbi:amidase [Streptomyces sp. SID13031]|uniref:amidase n=1 Tax=Streptomyces sp. SID13031 TaxID=2706046 RepID=UPI0013C68372|nr:amidase [Streptomyces sp. SID13031]NEA32901.1 amidase [Streptomyces sp. SID13031]
MSDDAADLSLVEVLQLLERRKLSARELVLDCLHRIELTEPTLRAFVTLTQDLALDAAVRADEARAAGAEVGPLAGVPVVMKDVFLTRGVLTTAGSRILAKYIPTEDAAVWERLAGAGAGLLGKSTTHEFAYGTASPPTANPWDITRTPGGSSGGSAAALAGRMAPIATGTDTGGSLRIPASACGVCTLRSARGRISRYGAIPLSPSFDVAGPMARRMRDLTVLLRVLAGYDPRDPGSRDEPVPRYPDKAPRDIRGIRIGLPLEMSWRKVDDRIAKVCQQALGILVDRGAELVEIAAPANAAVVLAKNLGVFDTINETEAHQIHDLLVPHSHLYTPQVRERVRKGEAISRERYEEALLLRDDWSRRWRRLMVKHRLDAIAHPTIDAPPPLIDPSLPPKGPRIRLSVPWSIADFPALSVPAGFDDRGLPVGLSLAGLPEREAELLGLGILIDEELQLWRHGPPTGP